MQYLWITENFASREQILFLQTKKNLIFYSAACARKNLLFLFFISWRVDRKFLPHPLPPHFFLHLLLKSDSASDYKTNAESQMRR